MCVVSATTAGRWRIRLFESQLIQFQKSILSISRWPRLFFKASVAGSFLVSVAVINTHAILWRILGAFCFGRWAHSARKTLLVDSRPHLFTVQKTIEICIMPFKTVRQSCTRHCNRSRLFNWGKKKLPAMKNFILNSGLKFRFINLQRWSITMPQ